ncbi:methyl-accepting chemotaxis protein [Myxococcota bacterium]|nr:methyl-accepting chemotaxis protein [Myxococcota bacterium]
MKLTYKLIVLCVGFAAIPSVNAIYTSEYDFDLVLHETGERFAELSVAQADKIDRNLYERYGDVQAFALNPVAAERASWHELDEAKSTVVRTMNQYVALYGVYDAMVLVDLDGRVVAANTRDAEGKVAPTAALATRNHREAPWFRALAAGVFTTEGKWGAKEHHGATGTFVHVDLDSEVAKSMNAKGDARMVVFAAPVKRDGKVIAYWANFMPLSFLDEIIAETAADLAIPGLEMMVVDSQGRLVAETGTAEKKAAGLGLQDATQGKAAFGVVTDDAKVDHIVATTPLHGTMSFPGLDWAMLVRAPVASAAPEAVAARRNTLIVNVALIALVLVGAVLFSRMLAKPIVAMSRVAERIAAGDLEQEVTHQSSDEIGQLAESFRAMLKYLDELAKAAEALSKGEFDTSIQARSDKDVLARSMGDVVAAVRRLVSDVGGLSSVATMGKVDARLDAAPFQGAYAEVAVGINQMLDAMLAPIQEATAVLEKMAARDLTGSMVGDYKGDHARLKNAVNVAVGNVRTGLLQVARGAEQVKAAAAQIAAGSQSLASGASEQAAALTETRSTLEGTSVMTERNAASAEKASMLAEGAHHASNEGATAMQQLDGAVARVRSAVTNTAEIIRDINQIAFQTNLLALNAAVEAARAGDAGRGFAVVADEVRNLAQQAKGAAHKTEELLRDAIRQSEQGESISREVSSGLTSIVSSVQEVDEIIKQIAAASREQAMGVHQVSQATAQMDQVTHQNAASSEELSSTAEELSAQALELTAMVEHFKLESDDVEAPRVAARNGHGGKKRGQAPSAVPAHVLIPFDDQVELRDF